jgi:glycosyltransferase involved in cell wall biosynthesis
VDLVVLTPTFHFKPFLKDAALVWWSTLVLRRRAAAWFHMDYRALHYESRWWLSRRFIRATLRRCRHFVLCADRLRSFMPDWLPRDAVMGLPNGIPAPIPPRARPGDDRVRVLYLSNLEPDKGWEILLEAARQLCREIPHAEFVFHGRPAFGLTEDDVRQRIAGDDGDGRITYLGPVYGEAKWQALADADIFAFPSLHESFPLAILEALAAGLPIAATDVGGVPDALTHGEGGFLVPPNDIAAIEAALRSLLTDVALRSRAGAHNRRRYEQDYTVRAFGERWAEWLLRESNA